MKRIVITERQLNLIKEEYTKERLIKKISSELSEKYEKSFITREGDNGPKKLPIFKKRYDGDEVPPKNVLRELKAKHRNLSEEFIRQIMKDWYNGSIDDDLKLSKNVEMK